MSRKVNTTIVLAVLAIAISIGGCAMLDDTLVPEEGQLQSDTVIMVEAIAKGLVATGNPYAVPALAGSTIFAILAGAYTNMRKKQKLADANDKAKQAAIVTGSIVDAIEQVSNVKLDKDGDTIGNVVKAEIGEKLKDNDVFLVGKAIIAAIKAEGKI